MSFKPMRTAALAETGPTKVLLYAHHGFGKTYQCRFYQQRYGNGLILSGESGLKSLEDVDIDYIPFTSWDGRHAPEENIYSFREILKILRSREFLDLGYRWLAIDSITELSERLLEHLEYQHKDSSNKYALWGEYSRIMLGTLKLIRDLPIHVYATCLAKEEKDPNDNTEYWPLIKGTGVSKQLPALFDHVFCGTRRTEDDGNGNLRVQRFVATDEVNGWHAKVRDPYNRLQALEPITDMTMLLARMSARPA